MISICCTELKPDYKKEFTPEEFQKFCKLVNQFSKQRYNLVSAQTMAYSKVLVESIPFKAAPDVSSRQQY